MPLFQMVDKTTNELDNNNYSVGIFIDLSKAFDTVDHHLFANKLYHDDVKGVALNWFVNYLSNRFQYVTLNNQMSAMPFITCGVPRDLSLGPLLFILFINDIVNTSYDLKLLNSLCLPMTRIYFLNINI